MAIIRKHYDYRSYGLLASTHYHKFKTLSVNLYSRLVKMATYTMERHMILFWSIAQYCSIIVRMAPYYVKFIQKFISRRDLCALHV